MRPDIPQISRRALLLLLTILLAPGLVLAQSPEYEFPGRAVYSTVKVLELEELHSILGQAHVVDVRSAYEFQTLHIKGAHHIALNDPSFDEKVRALKARQDWPVVFYCNGKTCYKSYRATDKAMGAGIAQVYSYDAGIFDWSRAYPDRAVLLGRSPIDPTRLIGGDKFKAHQLGPEEFASQVHSTNAVVIDVRESLQRAADSLFPNRQEDIALDDAEGLKALLAAARKQGRRLLIYDEAGKQVRWLQYTLEDQGVSDYYFMRGGVKAFYKEVLMAGG
jgi:rhodanese-related sulfurtransferase